MVRGGGDWNSGNGKEKVALIRKIRNASSKDRRGQAAKSY